MRTYPNDKVPLFEVLDYVTIKISAKEFSSPQFGMLFPSICNTPAHSGFRKPKSDCTDKECIVWTILNK